MFILRQQAGQAGQAQQADQSGCSASTINRAKRALKAAATEQPRAGRGGSGALVVLLGVNGDKDTAVVAELRRFVRELLGCSVSFDTALVTVRLADGRLAVLHVAGAISSAGCWLYPAPLKPIAGAGRGGCYDSSAFLEVLAALRTAVAAGELPVPSSAADICTALVKALALQAGQHLVWQVRGLQLLHQPAGLVWRGPEMRAAAAAAMSTGISHALQQ